MSTTPCHERRLVSDYLCGSPAQRMQDFIVLAQQAEWEVCVITTPHAVKFVDLPCLSS